MPDAIEDLRAWPGNALPIVSNWNTGGYLPDWHVDQVRLGNRFLPSFKFNPLGSQSPKSLGPKLRPENEAFLRDNRIPISLRSDNVATNITTLPRLPISLQSIESSPVVWTIKNGVLGDEGIADCFGPATVWRDAGVKWAKESGFILDLQKRFPDAAYVVLGDNNESGVDSIGRYVSGGVWKSDLPPTQRQDLATLSLRVRDYAETHTPAEFAEQFAWRRDWQYNAHWDGFNHGLTTWNNRLYTEAYKIGTVQPAYGDQFGHYDGGGSPLYVSGAGNGTTGDFTSPDWFKVYYSSPINLRAEAENPRHFREWFIQFFPGTAFDGYRLGRHEIITPTHIEAWAQWLLWSTRGNNRGVNLRYFTETKQAPTNPFLDSDASKQIVTNAGYPDLMACTEEDYIRPLMRAVNRIADNPVLRKYFQDGNAVQTGTHPGNEVRAFTTTQAITFPPAGEPDDGFRLLECDVNTPRSQWVRPPGPNSRGAFNPISIKVWATATELNGEYEINIWCPCPRPLSCNITLPNGWKFPVTITEPGMDFVVKPKSGFDVEVVQ